jgi:nucleotide-binding universal stress UspA family protein
MKNIVVGYDETPAADHALERAAEFAKAFDAKVIVASIAPVLHGRGIGPVDPVDPPALHMLQLRHAGEKLGELGIKADLVPGLGQTARTIVEVAEERDADMIIVGTRELHGLERMLKGSVSEGVERKAHCDVLIVH